MADEIQIEEMLEYIWILDENNDKADSMRMNDKFGKEPTDGYLKAMVEQKLINLRDSNITFTESGKERAKLIIRDRKSVV